MKKFTELKKRLRKNFRDDQSIQWSDELLDDILLEAVREYTLYSGKATKKILLLTSNSNGVCALPEDFYQIIAVYDENGSNIPIVSYRNLVEKYGDFRQKKGDKPECLCFNFESFGKARVYPALNKNTAVGTILYRVIPDGSQDIDINETALEHHAMFQMYQFTGNTLAQNRFKLFLDAVYQEQRQSVSSGTKSVLRSGVYF
jgi:hypothetical protein